MSKNVLKIAGVIGVVAGTVALVVAGEGAVTVTAIVEATVVLVASSRSSSEPRRRPNSPWNQGVDKPQLDCGGFFIGKPER